MPLARRATSLVLVAVVHALLMLLLMWTTPSLPPPSGKSKRTTVRLLPGAQEATERTPEVTNVEPEESGSSPPTSEPLAPPPPTVVLPPSGPSIWSQVIPFTREELAAADIGRMPGSPARSRNGSDVDTGKDDSVAAGGERGPNGERLYNAQWYRRPTRAELAHYIPTDAPRTGWGIIACQTIEGFRVDNCVEIDQSPLGSGLAKAVRQAAWQFRVLPPRIGGRPVIGAWVRIRIDYTARGAE